MLITQAWRWGDDCLAVVKAQTDQVYPQSMAMGSLKQGEERSLDEVR